MRRIEAWSTLRVMPGVLRISLVAIIGITATISLPLVGCRETVRPHVDADLRARVLEQGELCTTWFYDGEYEKLTARFEGSLKESIDVPRLRTMREELAANYGPEVEVLEQGVAEMGALRIYRRLVRFERQSATIEIQWTLDEGGKVHGFYLRPGTPTAGP